MTMKKHLPFRKVIGVEIFQRDGAVFYHFVVLEMVKGQMNIRVQETNVASWQALEVHLEKDVPMVLTLNIRGVLHKKVVGNLPAHTLAAKVLPNANVNDFYVQTVDMEGGQAVSLIRKDQLNEWTQPFLKEKYWLLDVRLGAFDVGGLLPFIRQEAILHTSTYDLEVNNQQISNFKKTKIETPQNVLLGDEYINAQLFPAIGSAFRMLMQAPINEIQSDALAEKQADFFQFQLFKTAGWAVLMVFLFLLLGNYFAFSHFSKKNQTINTQLIYQQQKLDELDSLKSAYEKQAALFKENNLTKRSKVSYYADEIGASVPNSIQLTNLNINPFQKPKRNVSLEEQQLPTFLQNEIHIKGKTTSSIGFNNWKRELQNFNWLVEIDQLQYQEVDGIGEFELVVQVKKED